MNKTLSLMIEGMTCGGCVSTVEKGLAAVPNISKAEVTLTPPSAKITIDGLVDLNIINEQIKPYRASFIANGNEKQLSEPKNNRYFPLLLIVIFIAGVSFISQFQSEGFDYMLWMRHFMAGFFIVFSFFKLLNIPGFARSYSMYDVIAKRWFNWGYIYPFIELTLGLFYLLNFYPSYTNGFTLVLLSIGTVGVVKSNLNKEEIQCACLGDVFDLPMSTITIIENVVMILMATLMIIK